MKKNLLITIASILLIGYTVSAQTYVTQVKPNGSKLWGYANQKGELIIPAQFAKCYKFSPEGLAAIYDQKDHQYYFINTKGEKLATEVASFKLKDGLGFDVQGFKNGLALVEIGDKWGYFNANGKIAVAAKYDNATDFDGGFATVEIAKSFMVINKKGEEFKIIDAGVVDVKEFSGGLAPFRALNKMFGFIGADGKVAIQAQYESVGYFVDGLAWAKSADKMLGYINTKGEWVIKPQFNAGKEFDASSGLARIKNGDKWAYVNKKGEIMYVNDTEAWGDYSDGLAEGKKGNRRGFYDAKGKWVIEAQFDGTRDFKNGFAAARQGDKWGMINKEGKWVIQPLFEGIKDMELVGK